MGDRRGEWEASACLYKTNPTWERAQRTRRPEPGLIVPYWRSIYAGRGFKLCRGGWVYFAVQRLIGPLGYTITGRGQYRGELE
jgi:hypothetical protein